MSSQLNAVEYSYKNKIILYTSPLVSYISFVIIIIFSFLIYTNRRNSFVLTRSIAFAVLFLSVIISLGFNLVVYYNKDTNIIDKTIPKINIIILSILLTGNLLYLILSHTFGCL